MDGGLHQVDRLSELTYALGKGKHTMLGTLLPTAGYGPVIIDQFSLTSNCWADNPKVNSCRYIA